MKVTFSKIFSYLAIPVILLEAGCSNNTKNEKEIFKSGTDAVPATTIETPSAENKENDQTRPDGYPETYTKVRVLFDEKTNLARVVLSQHYSGPAHEGDSEIDQTAELPQEKAIFAAKFVCKTGILLHSQEDIKAFMDRQERDRLTRKRPLDVLNF